MGHRYEHATADPHDDLLRFDRLVILFLLGVVTASSTGERAGNHGDVTAGASPDQAAKRQTAKATEYGADTTVVVGLHLRQRYLLDLP
ncbi:hypothetical protein D3C77_717460 [compost metagenome]